MTLVDVLILLLLVGAVFRGFEEGLVHQLFSSIGFFAGLLGGAAWIEPHVLALAQTPGARLAVSLATTLGVALILLFVGELMGILIKKKLRPQEVLNEADNVLGACLAAVTLLIVVWLGATAALSLPYPGIQRSVQQSAIVSILRRDLPPAPNVIADIGRLIAANGFPDVFIGIEPTPTTVTPPTPAALARAVQKDRPSVVKIEGAGCGGLVAGSGFVVGNGFVATNAHVVAGIADPSVIDEAGTHRATVVWFDPNLDFAVLRVPHLADVPLSFNMAAIAHGTPGGVLGYPGGGDFTADSAAVLDEFTAVGRNIYGQGQTERDVYSVQATVVPGNSGGPLVDLQGRVIGVVFATSTTYNNVGYALSLQQVTHEVAEAEAANQPVSTGNCAE